MNGAALVQEVVGTVSVCSLYAGEGRFGIETAEVREVLDDVKLRRVPLTPDYIAGVTACRGEILTVVSLRVLLGLPRSEKERCVLVLDGGLSSEGRGGEERNGYVFGLMVDHAEGVSAVREDAWEPNPGTLDARRMALFDGVYRVEPELVVRLKMEQLKPERLAECGLFADEAAREETQR